MTVQQVLLGLGVAPTYATWNPSDKAAVIALSGGNLTITSSPPSGTTGGVRATIGKTTGKWYWEVTVDSLSGFMSFRAGVADSTHSLTAELGDLHSQEADGSANAAPPALVISVLLDLDGQILNAWENGVDLAVNYDLTAKGMTGSIYPCISARSSVSGGTIVSTANFGASAFTYAMPAGYQRIFTQ